MDNNKLLSLLPKFIQNRISVKSNDSETLKNDLIKTYKTRWSKYQIQGFSFPPFIINYIIQNPTNPKLYRNLTKCCKYFYAKNSILLIDDIVFGNKRESRFECQYFDQKLKNDKLYDDPYFPYRYREYTEIKSEECKTKIWIIDELFIVDLLEETRLQKNCVSLLCQKTFKCNIYILHVTDQNITFNDFIFLSPNVKNLTLNNVYIKDKNDKEVLVEDILKSLPNLKKLHYYNDRPLKVSEKTVEKILKLPQLYQLTELSLVEISEEFDFEQFSTFLKNNKKAEISLNFGQNVSENYYNEIQTFIDKVLENQNSINFFPPSIWIEERRFENARAYMDIVDKIRHEKWRKEKGYFKSFFIMLYFTLYLFRWLFLGISSSNGGEGF